MLDAVCDIRTSTRATRLATTVDIDCYKVLSATDDPNCASMIAGAPASSYSLTAPRVGVDGLGALTHHRATMSQHTHATGSEQPRRAATCLAQAAQRFTHRGRSCAQHTTAADDAGTSPPRDASRHPPEVTRCQGARPPVVRTGPGESTAGGRRPVSHTS